MYMRSQAGNIRRCAGIRIDGHIGIVHIYRLGYVQIFQQGLGRTAVRRNIGQAGTVMAEQHRAVLVQHQGQRQLLLTVGRRVIAAALGIPHDLPCFQAVGA